MRKPNPIKHMILWGLAGGATLGILYGVSLLLFFAAGDGYGSWWRDIPSIIAFGGFYGALFGGVPGLVLGIADGLVLWYLLRKVEIPISMPELLVHQKRAQWIIAGVTFLGCYVVSLIFLGGLLDVLIVGVPSVIAAFAAYVVTRRYFTRLAQYAEKGKRKAKEA